MITFLQSVQAPNGLIAHMFGPIEGRRHDAFMLAQSGLHEKLINITKPNGDPYVVYGDPAYGLTQNTSISCLHLWRITSIIPWMFKTLENYLNNTMDI
jgi:hypothetical protein